MKKEEVKEILKKCFGKEKDDRYHETVPGKQNKKNRMMISFY